MIIKKFTFGQASASDFTLHKNEARKNLYINRHKKNENWNNKDTADFWSRWLLLGGFLSWEKPTINESYEYIRKKFNI